MEPINGEIVETFKNKEWYEALVEDCNAIMTEAVYNSRWDLVKGYWEIAQRIREDTITAERVRGNKSLVQDLARNIKTSERNIYYALQIYDKYPDMEMIPEGKNISWNKLITKYLPETKLELENPEIKEITLKDRIIKNAQFLADNATRQENTYILMLPDQL